MMYTSNESNENAIWYVQLATLFWLTAASNAVYKFVVLKTSKTTVEIELTAEELEAEIEKQEANPTQDAPRLTKQVSVMKVFHAACFGIPLLLVGGMLLPVAGGGEPTFSFQPLATTGWCSINMDSPLRAFGLFYMPLLVCMFYSATAYFFCWGMVKQHKEIVGNIDNAVLYDHNAALVKKKTASRFNRDHRAARVI